MRVKYKKPTQLGETRIKTFFAIFPITIGTETRWLEKVTVEQEYSRIDFDQAPDMWLSIKFIDL